MRKPLLAMENLSSGLAMMKSICGSVERVVETFHRPKSNGRDELDSEVEEMVASLRECKAARDSLRRILRAAESTVETLQEIASPLILAYGMHCLPDDILREVFEAGFALLAMPNTVSRLPAPRYPIRLTHVCRRFRLVALSTPRLWTKLENHMSPHQLNSYLRRSRTADLTLSLHYGDTAGRPRSSVAEFLAITTAHCHRWCRFEYAGSRVDNDSEYENDGSEYCYTHPEFFKYQNIYLPRLTSLYWFWDGYYPKEGDDHTLPFKNWNMPSLTHFEGINVLIDAESIGPVLESCDLRFDCDDGDLLDFCDTLGALENARNLRSLVFELSTFCEADQLPARTILRALKYFHIKMECSASDEGPMLTLLGTLELPSLSHISLSFDHDYGAVFNTVVDTVRRCPMLETFTFTFSNVSYPCEADILGKLAAKLPLLKEVTIRGVSLRHESFTHNPTTVSWCLLRLERCQNYESVWSLVRRIRDAKEHWNDFQLHISEYRESSYELRDILGEKLHIHPYHKKIIPCDVVL